MSGLSLPGRGLAAVYRVCNRGAGERRNHGTDRARMNVKQILNRFSGRTILVVGDVMLDEFIWGKVRRISPEAPVPIVEVLDETYRLGGAGNVAANIRSLEGNAIPIGVIGRDSAAERVLDLLKQSGVDTSG